MSQSNLLLVNIAATFARMGATVAVGLWTTRIAYRELGTEGFGAYSAAVGLIAFVMLLGDALSSSAQRHMAFAIGAGDDAKVRSATGTAVTVMLLLAAATGISVALVAPWLAEPLKASAPVKALLPTALAWIGVATAVTLAETPFRAYLVARQSIVLLSFFELLDAAARCAAAGLLLAAAGATIADYARWACWCGAVPSIGVITYCLLRLPATRPGPITGLRELTGFASWMLVGLFAWKLRTQGVQVLINLVAGAIETANYSVCMQLAMYQNSVSFAIYRAIRPALITAQGRGDASQVRRLSLGSSKAMGLVNLLITVPLWFETPTLLRMWIGESPDSMVTMVRLLIAWISVRDLTIGHEMAVHGSGRVGAHESMNLSFDGLALLVGGLAVSWGAPAWALVAAVLGSVVCQAAGRVVFFGRAANATAAAWCAEVLARYLAVLAVSGAVAAAIVSTTPASPQRCLALFACATIATLVAGITIGLTSDERRMLVTAVTSLRRRFA
jgi:O-antigen/teichoic acid export membrane protein